MDINYQFQRHTPHDIIKQTIQFGIHNNMGHPSKNSSHEYHCRVCGLEHPEALYGEGISPKYEFCSCCGVEHGYGDQSREAVLYSRDVWKAAHYAWFRPDFKPNNWDQQTQLKQVPEGYQES